MKNIYDSAAQLVGNTPLVRLHNLERREGLAARLLAKLEGCNPGGSAKDRVAVSMLDEAERAGRLHPGDTVVEPTSGNTGVGLCMACAMRGYKAKIVMPDSMSAERRALMLAYGAELVLTPGAKGMAGAIEAAGAIAEKEGAFLAGQFSNPANPAAHYAGTGPEIWRDTCGEVAAFVAGVGTGGTITGAGRYLKEKNSAVYIAAVEPADSAVLSGGKAGPHGIQGIGAGFVPAVLDTGVYNEVLRVPPRAALRGTRGCWRASRPARPFGRPCSLPAGRSFKIKLWWPFCRIPAKDTSPPACLHRSSDVRRAHVFSACCGYMVFQPGAFLVWRDV